MKLPNITSLLLVVLLSAIYLGPMADLDWSWQVRIGEQVVETGELRTKEAFSYTIAGRQMHDFEWLYEVTLYGIWSVFGIGGLKFVKMTLIAVPMLLVAWRLWVANVRWHGI